MKRIKTLLFIILLTSGICSAQTKVYVTNNGKPITVNGKVVKVDFDAATEAYIAAVESAGGVLSTGEKLIANYIVRSYKAIGMWDSLDVIQPFLGGDTTVAKINLKSPGTYDAKFVNTVAGDFDNVGWTENGSTSYMNTTWIPSGNISSSSGHMSVYVLTTNTGNYQDIGCIDATSSGLRILAFYNGVGARATYFKNAAGERVDSSTTADARGYYLLTRLTSTDLRLYRNNKLLPVATSAPTLSPTVNYPVWLGCVNNQGSQLGCTGRKYGYMTLGGEIPAQLADEMYWIAVRVIQMKKAL